MHGKGGEITVKEPEYTGMAEIFVEAAQQMGYPRADLNGNFTEGFDVVFYPIKNGRRFGVYGAVINTVRTRPSLTIRKFSMVKKVLSLSQLLFIH
jgi:choline dehydrogenase-like flavoprotein